MASYRKSPHILNTSTNLLGFCLIIITSIKVSKFNAATIIDEGTAAASLCLMLSCILSFLSMRTEDQGRSARLENIADIVFMVALSVLTLIIILVSFNVFA